MVPLAPSPPSTWDRRDTRWLVGIIGAWTLLYGWRAIAGHYSLRTNAYDLSVFDYALWNMLHGRLGWVPFYGYSIFSDHFEPFLALLLPVYALWPSATLLVVLQTLAMAGGGAMFYVLARRLGTPRFGALVLLVVFLIERRSHSAAVSYFYPESFQPLLMFAMVWCWLTDRRTLLWVVVALLLSTKEDAALYVGVFAAWKFVAGDARRHAAMLFGIAASWLAVAILIGVPAARHADGLSAAFPFWETRLGASQGTIHASVLVSRLSSWPSAKEVIDLLAGAGLLPVLAPGWLIVAVPGILIDLATIPGSMQASVSAHYALPVLPWLLLAAAAGATRLFARAPRLAGGWMTVVLVATFVQAPVVRHIADIRFDETAAAVRAQLPAPGAASVAAMPNLVPHLPHTNNLTTLFLGRALEAEPELVVLTQEGDLWPASRAEVAAIIARYQADARYEQTARGPLVVFRRRAP